MKQPSKGLGRSHLASLIENDLRKRGLRSGDRYLTAKEVSQALGVSAMTANRAMQELARRDILTRNRKSGTFVGARFTPERAAGLKCVHLLMPSEFFTAEKAIVDIVVAGIHAELPEDAIQFSFVPAVGDVAFVRNLVEEARRAGSLGGLILFLGSPDVQRLVRESGVPAVVSGSLHAGVVGLPSFDRDQKEIGRLLTSAALERGHRRLAVLMRDRWGAGDNLMIDGVHAAAGAAKLGADALMVRSFPSDPAYIVGAVGSLLKVDSRPTALICRSLVAAEAAAEAARAEGLTVPKDVEIFLADHYANDRRPVVFPHTTPAISPEEHGATIARMLKDVARGQPPPAHHVVPVLFQDPAHA